MHRVLWMLPGFLLCTLTTAQVTPTGKPAPSIVDSESFLKAHLPPGKPTKRLSPEIDKLIARMTLKEKVGQMTQLEIGMVSDGIDQALQVNPAKLRKAIVEYGVGSILNVKDEALP